MNFLKKNMNTHYIDIHKIMTYTKYIFIYVFYIFYFYIFIYSFIFFISRDFRELTRLVNNYCFLRLFAINFPIMINSFYIDSK